MKSEYTFKASWLDGVEELSDAEELALRRWIDAYALRKVEPTPDEISQARALLRLKWDSILRELNISRVRSESGKKGGAPVGNKNAVGKRVKAAQNKQKQAKNKQNLEGENKQKQAKNKQNLEGENKQKQAKNKQNSADLDENDEKQAKTSKKQAKYTPDLPISRAREINTTINNNVNNNEKAHINAREARVCVQEPAGSEADEKLNEIKGEFERYKGWLEKDHPYYADPENCEVLTLYQWHRLRQEYDLETIARATEDLDGRADYKRRGQVGSHFTYLRSFCENIKSKAKR